MADGPEAAPQDGFWMTRGMWFVPNHDMITFLKTFLLARRQDRETILFRSYIEDYNGSRKRDPETTRRIYDPPKLRKKNYV
jgi:hypothetical protein